MIGEFIRNARRARGLTQEDLAAASGISQPNISAIETGRREPSATTMRELLAGCGFELVAKAGERTIRLPLHADDAPGDVPAEPPLNVPIELRAQMLTDVLELVDAVMIHRA